MKFLCSIKNWIVFLGLNLSTCICFAQADIELKGYVVTNENDTIRGEVFDMQLKTTKGVIRVEYGLEEKNFKFKDVKAYKLGREVYLKRKHTSFSTKEGSFMQVMSSGDVILYRLDYKDASSQAEDQMQHDYYIEKRGGDLVRVDRSDFTNSILPFISDKPSIKQKVETHEWEYNDLALIVNTYNRS
ncbi:MAG: hypothetical protein ACPGJS_22865 [Flammeovirgaceae bacterium]